MSAALVGLFMCLIGMVVIGVDMGRGYRLGKVHAGLVILWQGVGIGLLVSVWFPS